MIRSLYTSATGMLGQELYMDVISNNLSNVNTTGFKKSKVDFDDLYYQTLKPAGVPVAEGVRTPNGILVGHGTRVVSTSKIYTQGDSVETGNPFDLAIMGDGFFRIQMPDGTFAYTRDGSFKIDGNGNLVNAEGYLLDPQITIPVDINEAVEAYVGYDGTVSVKAAGEIEPTELGQITLTKFINPAGLKNMGKNLVQETIASGQPVDGVAGTPGYGEIYQGVTERSNVQVVEEMVGMILAQRAYEVSSKSIQTSDTMLGVAAGLKR